VKFYPKSISAQDQNQNQNQNQTVETNEERIWRIELGRMKKN
jgi:hypothetical protein